MSLQGISDNPNHDSCPDTGEGGRAVSGAALIPVSIFILLPSATVSAGGPLRPPRPAPCIEL